MYEYKCVETITGGNGNTRAIREATASEQENALNEFANSGWRLISTGLRSGYTSYWILERQK